MSNWMNKPIKNGQRNDIANDKKVRLHSFRPVYRCGEKRIRLCVARCLIDYFLERAAGMELGISLEFESPRNQTSFYSGPALENLEF